MYKYQMILLLITYILDYIIISPNIYMTSFTKKSPDDASEVINTDEIRPKRKGSFSCCK